MLILERRIVIFRTSLLPIDVVEWGSGDRVRASNIHGSFDHAPGCPTRCLDGVLLFVDYLAALFVGILLRYYL